ncbi:hypothetical protein JNUCC64_12835 [Streptomyces sp. JNUCC 64]
MGIKKTLAIGAVIVGITAAAAVGCSPEDETSGSKKSGTSASSGTGEKSDKGGKDDKGGAKGGDKKKDAAKGSAADQFKAFVNKNGTPKEKEAAAHVTKVQGVDEINSILSSVDVYTDYTGGMMGAGSGPAKLLASAFADWKKTDSGGGLVTIYDAEGELISNGNF